MVEEKLEQNAIHLANRTYNTPRAQSVAGKTTNVEFETSNSQPLGMSTNLLGDMHFLNFGAMLLL